MEKSHSAPSEFFHDFLDESQYTEHNKLGEGGFAEVYRIPAPEVSRKYRAVKTSSHLNSQYLRKEWRILKSLSHENIVKVEENMYSSPTRSFMVMEYVRGRDLLYLCTESACVTSFDIAYISKCILSALAYLHRQSIYHRDMKLENVLVGARNMIEVTRQTTVKVCDFGFSSRRNSNDIVDVPGSIEYVSPEMIRQEISSRAKADIYAFSVTFYALCFNSFPLSENSYKFQFEIKEVMRSIKVDLAVARKRKSGMFVAKTIRRVYRRSSHFKPRRRSSADSLLKRPLYTEATLAELEVTKEEIITNYSVESDSSHTLIDQDLEHPTLCQSENEKSN